MPVLLHDVLDHAVVRRGAPTVLAGADRLDREVRWLHSSDIYEIAPLLRDGDLLLTTGLGLVGRDEADARSFVRSLAQRGVAALVLETCRYYTAAPAEMVAEAERVGLPMVGLDRVVPFVEVTEALNAVIVDTAVHRLRHADEVSQQLSSVLVGGGGVPEALDRLSHVLGAPVRFVPEGGLGEPVDAALLEVASELPDAVPVLVHGAVAGWLHTDLTGLDRSLGEAALERAATALSLAIMRDEHTVAATLSGRRHLAGLLLETGTGAAATRAALRQAALPADAASYVTVVGRGAAPGRVAAVLERACSSAAPTSSVTAIAAGTSYVVSVIAAASAAPVVVADVRQSLEVGMPLARIDAVAAIGPVARRVDDLPRSAQEASVALRVVWARAPRTRVVESRQVGLERALLHGHDLEQLQSLAEEHLGPLLAYDARRGGRLVDTLRALLESTSGKTGAAARLHIRRQSLYQRLSRITSLLATDLDDPGARTSLLVALHALDLSTSADRLH
ncbi:MAG: PucR family transcriptional regulator, purine catabolism regulatory protein [Actinomycetota bacterium]|jgi:purine catabolism regulator|nr:PucR family transcriptional regulator, purine catabolism regulatory protein [Actinomycetota bacterium]